jgi:hypothetical protein
MVAPGCSARFAWARRPCPNVATGADGWCDECRAEADALDVDPEPSTCPECGGVVARLSGELCDNCIAAADDEGGDFDEWRDWAREEV